MWQRLPVSFSGVAQRGLCQRAELPAEMRNGNSASLGWSRSHAAGLRLRLFQLRKELALRARFLRMAGLFEGARQLIMRAWIAGIQFRGTFQPYRRTTR